MENTRIDSSTNKGALTSVPPSELDNIYRSGRVSPDIQREFSTTLNRGLSSEGMTIDQYIERNRRLKIEMKTYLDNYKIQRSLMEAVIYYLRNPDLATVRLVDKLGGLLGKNLQLEAKQIANDPQAIRKLFEEMALSIEQSRSKTKELEKQAIALYNASIIQRENIDKDITDILQKISINKDRIIKLEEDYQNKEKIMDKLLLYMEKLGMTVKGGRPLLEGRSETKVGDEHVDIARAGSPEVYQERLDKLIKGEGVVDDTGGVDVGVVGVSDSNVKEHTNDELKNNEKGEIVISEEVKDKKKIEAIKVYHALNNDIVKSENLLRDATNEKLVLHQNYEKAKENIILYEKVLINQVNEARNYFAILFAIYDAEIKYTIPSARLIAHLASLQEVAIQLTQQIYDSRNIFNVLLDNVTQGALDIQDDIQRLAINPSWDSERLDRAEARTIELARRTKEFAMEMDRRLLEIEAVYKEPSTQEKIREKTAKDSGIEDEFLKNLLLDKTKI